MALPKVDSAPSLQSLVNYGEEDSDAESGEEPGTEGEVGLEPKNLSLPLYAEIPHRTISPFLLNTSAPSSVSSIVAYQAENDTKQDDDYREDADSKQEDENNLDYLGINSMKVFETKEVELGTIADISEDEDEVPDKELNEALLTIRASFTSEPETALTQHVRRISAEDVRLPPEPKGRCSKKLQDKITRYYKKNVDMNASIQHRKDFRNPSIYEKLISYLSIDELGTNYPKDVYNPHGFDGSSYYEALAKAQKEEMTKREKERRERTKVEFVSGVVKKPKSLDPPEEERKRKSKWDAPAPLHPPILPILGRPQITIITTTITNHTVASTTVSATVTKPTVISSFGTVKKPKLEKGEK